MFTGQKGEITAELDEKAIWKSEDGLVWAIKGGSGDTSFAAYRQGARLVVFEAQPIELKTGITYPVGVSRANEWQEPDINLLIEQILNNPNLKRDLRTEISTWFRHEAGLFVGRGTAKGPEYTPLEASLIEIAIAIDEAWQRGE